MKLSVAIPTYEYHGCGVDFLDFQFRKFETQTFKDFEIVISDHSINDDIEKFCKENMYNLKIKYIRNKKDRGSSSANVNNAILESSGDIIKIIFQDDFLYDEKSLEYTVNAFNDNTNWLVSGCVHTKDDGASFFNHMIPMYNDQIYYPKNTISSPSVLSIKNSDEKILFDERLIWMMDVDYYKRAFDKFGLPNVLPTTTVVNRIWEYQLSSTMSGDRKNEEVSLVKEKFQND